MNQSLMTAKRHFARRREFLQTAAASASGLIALPSPGMAAPLSLRPATFDATSDSVLVWLSARAGADLAIELSPDESMAAPRRVPVTGLTPDNDHTGAVAVEGLAPDQVWHYRVVDAASGAPVSDIGRFRTAPSESRPFTFAWSADMDESYQPFRLFDAIAARQPEFFLHLGDTIYADLPKAQFRPSVAHYRRKHLGNRRDTHLQRFLQGHATFAIWDDHETDNNCHSGHPHLPQARQVFREFWPCRSVTQDALYRRFSWAGVDFMVLDTRSHRSPQEAEDGPAKSMLGAAQKQWLLDELARSKAPFKFVVTSVPFQGGGDDTWVSYRKERDEIAAFIRARKVGGVVFLTGDYHLARDWSNPKAPYREFMAGPIGSFVHYFDKPAARDRYQKAGTFHYGDGRNFGLVQVDPVARKAVVSFVDQGGKTLGSVEFSA